MEFPDPQTTPVVSNAMDPLGEALHSLRMSGVFYCASELSEPWAVAVPRMDQCLMFHFVTEGACRLETRAGAVHHLEAGKLALLPQCEGHRLSSGAGVPAARLFDLPRELLSDRYEVLRHGGGGTRTHVICGAVRFDHPVAKRLVSVLPPVILPAASPLTGWHPGLLRLMAEEARTMAPGGETVITRLADILVIQAIRMWISEDPGARTGWLGALRDRQIGRALAAIHRDPGRSWTLAELAGSAAMSRSAFAARFNQCVGEPVMRYLARWRMQVATDRLRESDVAIGSLAQDLGYGSEAAFSRAFKREAGTSPGAVRRGGPVPCRV